MYATTIWLLHSIFPHYLMFPLLVSFLSVTLNHSYGITWFLSLSLGYHNSSSFVCTGGWDFLHGYTLFVISIQTIFRAAKGARWCSQDVTVVFPAISSWREKQRKSFYSGADLQVERSVCVW